MSILSIAITIVFASFLSLQLYTICRKLRMRATVIRFEKNRIVPSGSGVCHGMVLSGKVGVIKDQKNTPAWYRRLD